MEIRVKLYDVRDKSSLIQILKHLLYTGKLLLIKKLFYTGQVIADTDFKIIIKYRISCQRTKFKIIIIHRTS